MDNKSIIDRVVKDFYETGHLSESILKNNKDVKEEILLKIYKKQGEN